MPVPVIVLNFGHSVLRSLDDYTEAASEIYRHYRKGQNVVAVTSAQHDQTDILMAEARRIGPEGTAKNLAELIQLGERRSAALLSLALERVGAPAFVRQARDLGLKANSDTQEASITDLNVEQLQQDLRDHRRYDQISWDEAQKRASVLVAPKALKFAKENALAFDVGTLGQPSYTTIGPITQEPIAPKSIKKKSIVMMGCGIVGGGVLRRVQALDNRFEMKKIMVRNVEKYIAQGINPELLTDNFDDLIAQEADIFIDVSGPIQPALDYSRQMLSRGVHVVSANKQAIAEGGQALIDFAKDNKAALQFSSAAGGGMPVLEMCQRETGRITRVEALLNGTTNYMLGEITNGVSYADALKAAQEKGFAEADPSADVDGDDAAAKIRLVALLAFGQAISNADIPKESIRDFKLDASPKGAIKRIATCWQDRNGVHTSLEVRDLSLNNFIAQADGEEAHAILVSKGFTVKR